MKMFSLICALVASTLGICSWAHAQGYPNSPRDLVAHCASFQAGTPQAGECAARLSCAEEGLAEPKLSTCMRQRSGQKQQQQHSEQHQRKEREVAAQRDKEAAAQAARDATTCDGWTRGARGEPVCARPKFTETGLPRTTCRELLAHARRVRGDNLFVATEIVDAARRRGDCT